MFTHLSSSTKDGLSFSSLSQYVARTDRHFSLSAACHKGLMTACSWVDM